MQQSYCLGIMSEDNGIHVWFPVTYDTSHIVLSHSHTRDFRTPYESLCSSVHYWSNCDTLQSLNTAASRTGRQEHNGNKSRIRYNHLTGEHRYAIRSEFHTAKFDMVNHTGMIYTVSGLASSSESVWQRAV